MKQLCVFIVLFLFSASVLSMGQEIRYYNPGEPIQYDTIPYMIYDRAFERSYDELEKMFTGEVDYNFKRAEFLVENAYFGGTRNYDIYCQEIDSVVGILNHFIDINGWRQYKIAPNFAIFHFFTESSPLNGYKPFSYDFEDPMGLMDYSIFFSSNLLKTHIGQCTSLPILYKILCDELGGHSALAYAPMHLYIKHIGEDGKWVNLELTSGSFTSDIWMMESFNISTEAIRNGIFLCALSDKENVALMLRFLAKTYQAKYKSYDYFVERCVETVLKEYPNSCDALVLKFNLLQSYGFSFQERFGYEPTPYQDQLYANFIAVMNRLDMLGYSQPTVEECNARIEKGKRYVEEHKR